MLSESASPLLAHPLTAERRAALLVMGWPSAKELMQSILDENYAGNINVTTKFDFSSIKGRHDLI